TMLAVPPVTSRAAMATLVAVHGSRPRDAGSRMWVDADGNVLGSVTIGGCVDARVIEESQRVLETGQSSLIALQLGDEDAAELGMTCGGSIEVLIEPLAGGPQDPVLRALQLAQEELQRGHPVVLVRSLEVGGWIVVRADGSYSGSTSDGSDAQNLVREALQALSAGQSRVLEVRTSDGRSRVYFEVHSPPLTLLVVGATHVAMELVRLAHALGWRTVVVDGRESFAKPARFPDADAVLVGMPSELAQRLRPDRGTAVVLLAHDYKYDLPVLREVLASDAGYVGVLGSRRRGRALKDFLAAEGVALEKLERIRVPIGLDIGARTPGEIALSILAEALAALRGRTGEPLSASARRGGG
ncbi:MAG TPA: XdhC/CoxI family protein, partial [Gemmatimonadaceae bacterium]|nr:XdhC/CoxI family protein [Gemmatimonadaceae bacterium]